MTVREWSEVNPHTEMKYLPLLSPTGQKFRLAHAWRVGTDEPPKIGMFLYRGDQREGQLKTVFITFDEFMDDWQVRS